MDIRSDRQKGLSYVELGRKYHMDPRTAKRYAESPQKPEYTLSEPKPTKMDPYKQIVDEWLEEAPYSALRILEKLREMGFDGGYSIVKAYVSSRKMDLNEKATVRFETMPGKQGQMDWGFFEDHLVYEDGKWKKLYCFLMILGYSGMRYIEFVTDMSTNLHQISYQRKDMVVNPQHYRRLTLKQTMDAENVLLEQGKVIDFPLKPSDLSRYDEVLYE